MELTDCAELSSYKRYKQALSIFHTTSRANNPNWYTDALAIECQLHVFIGSDTGAISYIHNQKEGSWTKGPNLTPQVMASYEQLEEVLKALIEAEVTSKKPALGVILYIADEFATAELGADHQNPAQIDELRELIIEDPSSVLDDRTLSNQTHSWRLFPYPGASGGKPFATAISFSRIHEDFISNARNYGEQHDIPVLTRAISAPLCTITALPWLLEKAPDNGFVAALHYPRFTVLSFFNNTGDLIFIRTLQHHGNMSYPPNIGGAIMTTANSLELENPHIFILPMAGRPPEGMADSLSQTMPSSSVITLSPTSSPLHIPTAPNSSPKSDLPGVTRAWKWSDLHATPSEEAEPELSQDTPASTIPGVTRPWKIQDMQAISMLQQVRLEVVAISNPPASSQSPLASSHTFSTLISEMWPIQDFLPCSKAELSLYPSALSMQMLRTGKYLKAFGIAAATTLIGYTGWIYWNNRQHEAWDYEPALATQELKALNEKEAKFKQYKEIMKPRSRAWSSMEAIFHLCPPKSEITLTSYQYKIIRNQIQETKNIGFNKVTTLTGLANQEAIDTLNGLNSNSNRTAIFKAITEATNDNSFNTSVKGRDPIINLQTTINSRYKSNKQTNEPNYQHTFTLKIEQMYTADDALSFTSLTTP